MSSFFFFVLFQDTFSCQVTLGSSFSQIFHVVGDQLKNNCQVYQRFYCTGICYFCMVRLELSFFFLEKEHICKVPFSSRHIKGVCHQSDLSFLMLISVTLLKKWLTDFTNVKCCFLYRYPYGVLWREITFGQPILEGGELFSISLRTKYLHRLFGIFFVGDLSVIY